LFYKLNILLENTEVSVGFNEQELEQMTIYEIYFQNVIYQCHIKYVRTAATKKNCVLNYHTNGKAVQQNTVSNDKYLHNSTTMTDDV